MYFRNTGSSTARAWPILFIDCDGETRSFGGSDDPSDGVDKELGSRKYRIYLSILDDESGMRGLTLSFELIK